MEATGSEAGHGSTIRESTEASDRRAAAQEYAEHYKYAGGGEVAVPYSRRQEALKSKNERKKFASELRTARVFALAGHKVEFTPHGAANHDVYCDGIPADIKKLSSANNIKRHSKHAIEKQGAKLVLLELTARSKNTGHELAKLSAKGIHGYYFYSYKRKIMKF